MAVFAGSRAAGSGGGGGGGADPLVPLMWGDASVGSTVTDRFMTPGYDSGAAGTVVLGILLQKAANLSALGIVIRNGAGNGNDVEYQVEISGSPAPGLLLTIASTSDGIFTVSAPSPVAAPAGSYISIRVSKDLSIGASPQDIQAFVALEAA